MSWREHLRTHGYAQFARLTPAPLVRAARAAITRSLATNYQPARQLEYDHRSYCPELRGTAPITALIECPPVRNLLDEAFGLANIEWDGGQIAIRRAHNHPAPTPPGPHIDGFASGANGLAAGQIYSFTALVGIFLTPVEQEYAGNFTVWPGSHHVYERYFRARGRRALAEPMPTPAIGRPVQLRCGVGDVVLAHYELAHAAAVNTGERERMAIYFRLWLRGLEQDRWHYLTNIWAGWKI